MMDMTSVPKWKNLLGGDETPHEKEIPSTSHSLESFLEKMGVEWEKRGKATYIYPSSLEQLKKMMENMPNPEEGEYIIIPLGQMQNYNVFVMITQRSISLRIGYGRNSIPFSTSLTIITQKVEKVAKEIGIQSIKNSKNLIED